MVSVLAGVQRWLARVGDDFWELGQLGGQCLSLVTHGREEHGCIGVAEQRTPYSERALQLRGPGHDSTTARGLTKARGAVGRTTYLAAWSAVLAVPGREPHPPRACPIGRAPNRSRPSHTHCTRAQWRGAVHSFERQRTRLCLHWFVLFL